MNCETFLNLLDDYADGLLSPDQAQQMADHARTCPHCQSIMVMRQDLRILATEDAVPEAFSFAWRSHIQAKKRRAHPALRVLASAAAVLLFLIGGTLWHRDNAMIGSVTESAPLMRSMDTDTGTATFARKVVQPTLWEQIADLFRDMGQFLLTALPYLAVVAVLVILFLILKKHSKKRKE